MERAILKKFPIVFFPQLPITQLSLPYVGQLELHPTTQQDQLEHTTTAELPEN